MGSGKLIKGRASFIVQKPARFRPRFITGPAFLITDKDGVRYEFPDVSALDAKSRAILSKVQ